MATTTFDPQTESPLSSLPAEPRDRIYGLVLTVSTEDGPAQLGKSSSKKQARPTCLSLIQTCRLIHSEAQTMFHAVNFFKINVDLIRSFTRRTSIDRLNCITILTVQISEKAECVTRAVKSLTRLANLKKVTMKVEMKSIKFFAELIAEVERGFVAEEIKRKTSLEQVKVIAVGKDKPNLELYAWDPENGERLVGDPFA
ncbi:hypothetical protein BDY17DRAFT_147292 [Neohortaea acidophila]|uniref:Uncharacterized protein n=1 Tax=Neohortaea acidophila TaxID=245834 RepID=A0A6A6PVC6_9PEZI|nr:uncharacterized protein BDY17DRAFT_147292 [Neohortaea acidophila]KAF2483423.1 hypothetical protein BDY17DRAFT_147292 [Neohortaea acidophila]